jgi:hypothetical protein
MEAMKTQKVTNGHRWRVEVRSASLGTACVQAARKEEIYMMNWDAAVGCRSLAGGMA